MKRVVIALVLLFIAVEAREISFEGLIAYAKSHSAELGLYAIDIDIESSRVEEVKAVYYPTLSLGFNTEYNKDLDKSFNTTTSVGDSFIPSGTRYQSSMSLSVNYALFDFGLTEKKVKMAKREVNAKRMQWCRAETQIYRKLLDIYVDAYKRSLEIRYGEEIAKVQKYLYRLKKRLRGSGMLSALELGDEAMAVLERQQNLERTKKGFQEALLALSEISYMPLDLENTTLKSLEVKGKRESPIPFSASAAGRELIEMIRKKEEEIGVLKRSLLPSFSFYSNYYLYGSDYEHVNRALKNLQRTSWRAGIGVRLTLFEGFSYNSRMERLRLELRRLKEQFRMEERKFGYEHRKIDMNLAQIGRVLNYNESKQKKDEETARMSDRLRQESIIEETQRVQRHISMLERELAQAIDKTDRAYEMKKLEILFRKVDECSLH